MLEPFQLLPQFHARVWGGQRLKTTRAGETPVGEAWLVHEHNRVRDGRLAGRTLESLAQEIGVGLLGSRAVGRTGSRFPLLIKLLDCADWLSIQVHPNDAQAVQMDGAGQFGKTEAWHLLEVTPGAELIAGVKPGVTAAQLEAAIRGGTVREVAQFETVQTSDTVMMPAGTMHALGPGMLLYEVQQTSDLTYRVYDWDRPASAGRALHIEESVAVTRPTRASVEHLPVVTGGAAQLLAHCPYFDLELLVSGQQALQADPAGLSLHAITVIEGEMSLEASGARLDLGRFETVVVPAQSAAYTLSGGFRALRSSVGA